LFKVFRSRNISLGTQYHVYTSRDLRRVYNATQAESIVARQHGTQRREASNRQRKTCRRQTHTHTPVAALARGSPSGPAGFATGPRRLNCEATARCRPSDPLATGVEAERVFGHCQRPCPAGSSLPFFPSHRSLSALCRCTGVRSFVNLFFIRSIYKEEALHPAMVMALLN
jgi:hypothetical protein